LEFALWFHASAFSNQDHSGKHLSDIQHSGEQVTAIFADETRDTADLLIGADGPNSTVRQRFLPDVHYRYAGYVAYRDWLTKPNWSKMLPLFTERFVFYHFPTRTFSM